MAHVYATVAEANDQLTSGGSTKFASEAAAIVALKLSALESVSRRIDEVSHRSAFGSGFGPRLGTHYYDGDGTNTLLLRDDVQSIGTLSIAPVTGGTPATATLNTDYYLVNADGYTGPPWRKVVLHGQGSPTAFGAGIRTISTPSTTVWGHSNTTVALTATASAIGTTTTTSVTVSAGTEFSAGLTLLIESEQLYVTAVSGTTLTVVRGANGTTAATHGAAAAIAKYVYDARVHETCLRLFQRRWKARDAGADGTSGGLDVPAQQTLEGEKLIIERGLAGLLLVGIW